MSCEARILDTELSFRGTKTKLYTSKECGSKAIHEQDTEEGKFSICGKCCGRFLMRDENTSGWYGWFDGLFPKAAPIKGSALYYKELKDANISLVTPKAQLIIQSNLSNPNGRFTCMKPNCCYISTDRMDLAYHIRDSHDVSSSSPNLAESSQILPAGFVESPTESAPPPPVITAAPQLTTAPQPPPAPPSAQPPPIPSMESMKTLDELRAGLAIVNGWIRGDGKKNPRILQPYHKANMMILTQIKVLQRK